MPKFKAKLKIIPVLPFSPAVMPSAVGPLIKARDAVNPLDTEKSAATARKTASPLKGPPNFSAKSKKTATKRRRKVTRNNRLRGEPNLFAHAVPAA